MMNWEIVRLGKLVKSDIYWKLGYWFNLLELSVIKLIKKG